MALALPKSRLYEANARSAAIWQADLKKLFHHAKERYADVVWELVPEGETEGEEVWGHKAIVYARAPTSFQALYFSFRPAPTATPDLYGYGDPDKSTYSLHIEPPSPSSSNGHEYGHPRGASPASQAGGGLLRLTTSINPALFSNELEYLYTAQGMGEAFEFLFDSPADGQGQVHETEEMRMDKLRKDLCYMWRSRLFSDVRIALSGADFKPPNLDPNDSSTDTENTAVVFFSHRFVLVSRSPYFHKCLQASFAPPTIPLDGSTLTLQLPSSAFTPASLHWALGFMYTGTLNFSHRTFDLDTAFAIVRSSAYLLMQTMSNEIEAHIIEEMLHGLFHAYLTFEEYEKITAGKWGVGGCRCRQCQRRAPRVLEFALAPDTPNKTLERGARRALVGMFGEGWCSPEFANLSTKMRALLLKGVQTRTNVQNIFPLLFAAQAALTRLDNAQARQNGLDESQRGRDRDGDDRKGREYDWRETVREMILKEQKTIDEVLCDNAEKCFETQEWLEIMDSDGVQFSDMDRVDWIMQSVVRGLRNSNAPLVYQTIVSTILLRPHPTDTSATLLPTQSPVRLRVEETRVEILRWIKRHWVVIRIENGFNGLENWSLKEIGHELEMNVPDLLTQGATGPKGSAARAAQQAAAKDKDSLDPEMESVATTSIRAGVTHRNPARSHTSNAGASDSSRRQPLQPIKVSIRAHPNRDPNRSSPRESLRDSQRDSRAERDSLADSFATFSSAQSLIYPDVASSSAANSTPTTPKLLGTNFSRSATLDSVASSSSRIEPSSAATTVPPSRTVAGRKTIMSTTTSATDSPASARPKSIAASVKSTTSTIRRGGTSPTTATPSASNGPSSTTPAKTKAEQRRASTASTTANTGARTAPRVSAPSLSRPSSRVSDVSTSFQSARSGLDVPPVPRSRTVSMASTTSTRSMKTDGGQQSAGKTRGNLVISTPKALRPRKTSDASIISTTSLASPRAARPSSQASVRSTTSTRTNTGTKRTTPTKAAEKVPEVPKRTTRVSTASKAPSVKSVKKSSPPSTATASKDTVKPKPKPEPTKQQEIPPSPIAASPPAPLPAPAAPPVVVQVDEEEQVPPPVPVKEDNRNTLKSIGGLSVSSATPTKDKRPSATSTMSTNSESTIRLTRKRSNDTITEKSEDVSTLRANTLAKLVGGSPSKPSPSRPSAMDAVRPLPELAPSPSPSPSPTPIRPRVSQMDVLKTPPATPPTIAPRTMVPQPYFPTSGTPQGITLNVGIPCIISSRRTRFRAFARYLGEVAGEVGPWVGVEVPVGEFSGGDKLDGRDWHDGTWNGIKYFDIQGSGWDDEERAGRRRRFDPYHPGGRKRDADTLSVDTRSRKGLRSVSPAVSDASTYESRGLFVRPQQVLYVVDARAEY